MREWVKLLSIIPELRHPTLLGHGYRVAEYTKKVAQALDVYSDELYYIAFLHDIGKIIIPEMILSKPKHLEQEEISIIKEHPVYSEKLISKIKHLKSYAQWARWHHEYVNGKGYPDGIPSLSLPLEVRILAVCNAYAALTEQRPYRKAFTSQEAKQELKKQAGTKWDADVVKVATKVLRPIKFNTTSYEDIIKQEKRIYAPILRLQAIYRIGEEIKNLSDVDNFFKRVLFIIKDVLGIKGKYFLLVPDGDTLKVVAQVGANESVVGLRMPKDMGLSTYAFRHTMPVISNDVEKDERFYPTPGEDVKSEIAVPVMMRNTVLGVIDIESVDKDSFTMYDRQFIEAVAGTIAPVLEAAEVMLKLRNLAFMDSLTGAYSYAYLENEFSRLASTADREKSSFSLVFIDLDSLKRVNDTKGHLLGDKLLILLVRVFKQHLRKSDFIVRYGGDEFIVILWGSDKKASVSTIERIKGIFEKESIEKIGGDSKNPHSFSYGVSVYPKDGKDLEKLIKKADAEMYKFKALRKGLL